MTSAAVEAGLPRELVECVARSPRPMLFLLEMRRALVLLQTTTAFGEFHDRAIRVFLSRHHAVVEESRLRWEAQVLGDRLYEIPLDATLSVLYFDGGGMEFVRLVLYLLRRGDFFQRGSPEASGAMSDVMMLFHTFVGAWILHSEERVDLLECTTRLSLLLEPEVRNAVDPYVRFFFCEHNDLLRMGE